MKHVSDLSIRDGELALPTSVGGICLGLAVVNGEAFLIGFKRSGEVTLRLKHVAELVIRN